MAEDPIEAEVQERFGRTIEELAAEAERGYCTEHLGGGKYCLRPAVGDVDVSKVGVYTGGLKCDQHILGWPSSVITWLS